MSKKQIENKTTNKSELARKLVQTQGQNALLSIDMLNGRIDGHDMETMVAVRDEQARELKAQRTGKKDFRDLDDYEGLAVESAVVRCVGWKNVSVDGEAELEFNSENARMVFERFVPVREQVIEASDDLGNFRPA